MARNNKSPNIQALLVNENERSLTLGKYKELVKRGYTSESPELSNEQREAMGRFESVFESLRGDAITMFDEHSNKIKESLSQSSLTLALKSIPPPDSSVMRVFELLKDFEINWIKRAAYQAVTSLCNDDDQGYGEAIEAVNEHLNESEKPIAELSRYTRCVFEYMRMELNEFREEERLLSEENKRLAERYKLICDAPKTHRQDGIAKSAFQAHVRDNNIVVERMTDFQGGAYVNGALWNSYENNTLKKWYKEAMPNVTLKAGKPKKINYP